MKITGDLLENKEDEKREKKLKKLEALLSEAEKEPTAEQIKAWENIFGKYRGIRE